MININEGGKKKTTFENKEEIRYGTQFPKKYNLNWRVAGTKAL